MKKSPSKLILALLASAAIPAMAQNAPQSNTVGDGSTVHQQVIGDTLSTADHTNSVSNQLGNSANANGAQVNPVIDTRDQNTVTSTGGAATGGAATGNLSNNDNRSNASNGNQTMGQANTGNSSIGNTTSSSGGNILGGATSSSGGNILGGATSGGNTLTNGSNTATNTAFGGAGGSSVAAGGAGGQGGQGGQGGAGGSVLGAGNSTNTLGQQQGINNSGNSDNRNTNTSDNRNTNAQGQGQGQQQAATSVQGQGQQMGQGQSSTNRVDGSQRTNTTVGGQNASTRSGVAGSGNAAVQVDTSDRSVNVDNSKVDARSLYIPQVVAATPPSVVPSTTAVAGVMGCGPLQQVVRTPVVGKFYGFFSDNDVPQGWTEDLVPYTVDANGSPVAYDAPGAIIKPYHVIGGKPFGHIVLTNTAVVGVSGGRNLAIGGGGGSNMNWGQAGGGSSGASQRLVTTVQLRLCQIEEKQQPVAVTPSARVELPVVSRIGE